MVYHLNLLWWDMESIISLFSLLITDDTYSQLLKTTVFLLKLCFHSLWWVTLIQWAGEVLQLLYSCFINAGYLEAKRRLRNGTSYILEEIDITAECLLWCSTQILKQLSWNHEGSWYFSHCSVIRPQAGSRKWDLACVSGWSSYDSWEVFFISILTLLEIRQLTYNQ